MRKKCLSLSCYVSRRSVDTEQERCIVCGKPLVPEVNTVDELLNFLDNYKENQ